MDIIHQLAQNFPHLQKELRSAHIKLRPDDYIKKVLAASIMFSIGLTVFAFFMLALLKKPIILIAVIFPVLFCLMFLFILQRPKAIIAKRRRELDKEVLFAGRFLLIKLRSGVPLLNALIQASQSYGVASKYFKEIVDDINVGTDIEKALDNAIKYTPSPHFRKVLFQISNALKIGIDISVPLKNALDEIGKYEMMEITKYGKKLNSMAIFYMLLAVVMPSLGVVMLVVIGSLTGLLNSSTVNATFKLLYVILFSIQIMFIMLFKTSRVSVNV